MSYITGKRYLDQQEIYGIPSKRKATDLASFFELLKAKNLTLSENHLNLIMHSENTDSLIDRITEDLDKIENGHEIIYPDAHISFFDWYLFLLIEVLDQGAELYTPKITVTFSGINKGLFKLFSTSEKQTLFKRCHPGFIKYCHFEELLKKENGDDVKIFLLSIDCLHYRLKILDSLKKWDKKDLRQLFDSIGIDTLLDHYYLFSLFMELIEFDLDKHFEYLQSNTKKFEPTSVVTCLSRGIKSCSKDQAIFLIKTFPQQNLLKVLHPFIESHQISLLHITNEWTLNPTNDLRVRIENIATSLIGKMQWAWTNRLYCNDHNVPNDFTLKYLKGDIPSHIQKIVQDKWSSLFTPNEFLQRLFMCCWQFCYVVYLLANHISEEMVSTLLQSGTLNEDVLTAATHCNQLNLYRTTDTYKPQIGDLILYKRSHEEKPHHAAIYMGNNRVIHLLSSQIEWAPLDQKTPNNNFGAVHHIPVSLIPINIHNYIKTHPNPSFKPASSADVTFQLLDTPYMYLSLI